MSNDVRAAVARLFSAGFTIEQISRTVSLPVHDVRSAL